jgi:glutamate--cysteine ligase
VPRLGLKTPFRARTLREVAREVLALSEGGLLRRARLNKKGEDEIHALKPLLEIVEMGRTEADRLLAAYDGPWDGNIDRLFETEAL